MKRVFSILLFTCLLTVILATVVNCKKKSCKTGDRDPNCVCTMIYDPVCGCDGKSYGNPCEAECYGVKEYTKGECGK